MQTQTHTHNTAAEKPHTIHTHEVCICVLIGRISLETAMGLAGQWHSAIMRTCIHDGSHQAEMEPSSRIHKSLIWDQGVMKLNTSPPKSSRLNNIAVQNDTCSVSVSWLDNPTVTITLFASALQNHDRRYKTDACYVPSNPNSLKGFVAFTTTSLLSSLFLKDKSNIIHTTLPLSGKRNSRLWPPMCAIKLIAQLWELEMLLNKARWGIRIIYL